MDRLGRALRQEQTTSRHLRVAAAGAAVGAALVYWLDSERGARRRTDVRQQAEHAAEKVADAAEIAPRDIADRGRGIVAVARRRFAGLRDRLRGETADDRVVTERVRAKIGRVSSHPGAIEVRTTNGRVTLSGPILQSEADAVLGAVWRTAGVHRVDDMLEMHDSADNVPALQGAGTVNARRLRDEWSPALRFVSGTTGLGLLAFGGSRIRSPAGAGMALAGSALLLRGLANVPVRRLTGVGAGRRAVDLEKTIHIDAPVEKVFAFFEEFQNFPRFMTHILDVSPAEEGRWRWSVTGPGNVPVSWESRVTESEPNRLLAWESVPGSTVSSAGQVRFEPANDGGTRVHVRLPYKPPEGATGHAFATILGAHPKKQLDDDLMRLKALMEIGRVRSGSETTTRNEVAHDTDRSLH